MGQSVPFTSASETTQETLPELSEAQELCDDLRRILVRSENALIKGDARDKLEQVERWIESYRRGLSAAKKLSCSGIDILQQAREQLRLSLEERLRLEDEGGNPPTKETASDNEELTRAIQRIDRIIPVVEHSFQATHPATPTVQ